MTTDYGLTGGVVAQAEAQLKFAKEAAEKAREAAEREKARLAREREERGGSYAENQARIQAEREAANKREAEEAARRLESKLRNRYMAQPGATEAEFERAKPDLLRQYRERQTLGLETDVESVEGTFSDPRMWGLA